MMNWTAIFLERMSVISRSMFVSLIIVGAKTTAKFRGVIYIKLVEFGKSWNMDCVRDFRSLLTLHEKDET